MRFGVNIIGRRSIWPIRRLSPVPSASPCSALCRAAPRRIGDNRSMDIVLANPRGFCAGVDRAIEIVKRAIETLGAPIYVRHEVVHNRFVVDDLRSEEHTSELQSLMRISYAVFCLKKTQLHPDAT